MKPGIARRLYTWRAITVAFAIIIPCLSFAADSDFGSWKQQQIGGAKQTKSEFERYRNEIRKAFDRYRKKTGKIWGERNVVPGKTTWVSYIDKLSQRSVVDFNKGTVEIELATSSKPGNEQRHSKRLEKLVLKAMLQGDDRRSIKQLANRPVAVPTGDAVLSGQISKPDGSVAEHDDYRSIATTAAQAFTSEQLLGDDGKTRIVYRARLKLVPDHIRRRAHRFQPLVTQYAIKYDIPAPLINAVIETESMFNPTARSPAPAFGLMQLVPTSGARDAYKYVYKKDRVVSDKYLYDPDNNIHLGTAYLSRLSSGYLAGISSAESRLLASIAAYNTGASNVLRAFAGSFRKSKHGSYDAYKRRAFDEINQRTPEQVYQHLATSLGSREARQYIQRVTRRMQKYGDTKGLTVDEVASVND